MIIHNPKISGSLQFPSDESGNLVTMKVVNGTLETITLNSSGVDQNVQPSVNYSGSFTGSFVGDGSNLTGVSAINIDALGALGSATVAQGDNLVVSDAGTEKKVTFSNLEDSVFGNVSGDVTIAAGGAATIANSFKNDSLNSATGSYLTTVDISSNTNLAVSDTTEVNMILTGDTISAELIGGVVSGSAQISGITSSQLAGSVANAKLANSAITISGTSVSLGGAITDETLFGGTGVVTGSAQITGITNTQLAGSIANAKLANSAITISGTSVSLGGAITDETLFGGVGVISGSAQVDGTAISNKSITIAGNSTALGGSVTFANIAKGTGTISGSAQLLNVATDFGSGRVSGENFGDTAGTTDFTGSFIGDGTALSGVTSYTDSDNTDHLNSLKVVSGSNSQVKSFLSIAASDISDVAAFAQDGTYASLRAQGTTAGDVGLGNVTNESKSTMFTSPTFTGTPISTTPSSNDDSTKIATTAYVQQELTDLIGTAGSTVDTLGELSASLAADSGSLSSLVTTVGTKLAKASNLSDLSNAGTARTNLGVAIGSDVQAYNSTLATVAGGTYAGDNSIVTIGTVTAGNVTSILPSGVVSSSAQVSALAGTSNDEITLTAGAGLDGGGAFTLNQSGDETITFTVGDGVISGSAQLANSSVSNESLNAATSSYLTTVDISTNTNLAVSDTSEVNMILTGDTISAELIGGVVSGSSQISGVTNSQLAGSIANGKLANSAVTISGTSVSLGGSITDETLFGGVGVVTGSAQITHDSTTGFVANEHIDHSSVSITAGTGLNGGGTIASTRTLNVDDDYLNTSLNAFTASNANTSLNAATSSYLTTVDISSNTNLAVSDTSEVNMILSGDTISAELIGGVVSGSSQVTNIANSQLAGSIGNSKLSNSAITISGTSVSLGGAITDETLFGGTGVVSGSNQIASTFAQTILDDADAGAVRTTLGVDAAGTVNYTLPTNLAGDDINIDTTALTGATVISDLDFNITTNTSGLVTDANGTVSTRDLTAGDLSLGNVTNESKATMFTSPTFTGTPISTTPSSNDNSTKIATTAYVQTELTDLVGNAPAAFDTLGEISASLAADSGALDSLTTVVAGKLAKSSNLSDLSNASTARTNLGVDASGTDNSTNVTLAGTPNYITISGQEITRNTIDIGDDTNLAVSDTTEVNMILSGDTLSAELIGGVVSGSSQITNIANSQLAGSIANGKLANSAITIMGTSTSLGGSFSTANVVSALANTAVSNESLNSATGSYITAVRGVTAGGNTLASGETLAFTAGTNVTITESGGAVTITSTDTNTQLSTSDVRGKFSAGEGIDISSGEISGEDASTSNKGIVELATTAETTTGTDTGRAVTPDGLKDGYQGSTNVTTLGTIATGTWNGSVIDKAYIDDELLNTSLNAATSSYLTSVDISSNTNLAGGTGITLTGDTLSTTDSEIVHDDLSGFVANEHIDHSGVSIIAGTGLSGGGTIASSRTLNIDSDYLNTSLNAATSSYLTSVDISSNTNLAGGTGITLTGDTLSTTDSEIVHDDLSGFVANEHIDHSSVSITAGTGLNGGGTIASTRTLNVDDDYKNTSLNAATGSYLTTVDISSNTNLAVSDTTEVNMILSGDTISAELIGGVVSGSAQVASTFAQTILDDTSAGAVRTTIGVDAAGTDNSTNVTLGNTNYLSISGQEVTGGTVPIASGGTGATSAGAARTALGVDAAGTVNYTLPTNLAGDDIDIDTTALSGATVISDLDINITTNTSGLVTDANGSVSTRTLTASDLSLGNVTNESKSTMFTSPTFTGTTAAPTPSADDDSTKIATTAYVQGELTGLIGGAPAAFDTLLEISASIANGDSDVVALTTTVGTKLAKSSNLSDLSNAGTARTNLGVDAAGTDNSTNVSLTGTPDYITISGQTITRNQIDLANDVTGVLPSANLDSDTAHLSGTQTFSGAKSFSSAVNIDSTTASTSKTTGALIVDGGVGVAGALNVGGDIVAFASSDERLKDNIELISNPIEKVQSLKGVTWNWNSNADELQQSLANVGVIAQDVEKVLPQLVTDRDNGYKGVDYAKLTGLLIEAIKDQQKQIDELKSKLS
jgi:hypothetical protein